MTLLLLILRDPRINPRNFPQSLNRLYEIDKKLKAVSKLETFSTTVKFMQKIQKKRGEGKQRQQHSEFSHFFLG